MRLDKRGRKIGRNWWREYNLQIMHDANDAVAALAGANHQMEPDEFLETHPLVTFKQCLIGNAGMHRPPES